MLQELKFFPPLCSTIIGWTMSEEEERKLPFFYLTCPSSLPPGSHRLFVGVYAHCWTSYWRGKEIMQNGQPLPRRCLGCLGEWKASEQNWDSFGKGGGGHFIYCLFHSLLLCLEEVDNGVAKTFPPKFCTVWLDGNRLIQGSRGRCRLETQAITTLWIKSKLVLTSPRTSSCVGVAAAAEQEGKRRRGLRFLFQLL